MIYIQKQEQISPNKKAAILEKTSLAAFVYI
jgi:hypothetical protein